jgi:hypothetical protein
MFLILHTQLKNILANISISSECRSVQLSAFRCLQNSPYYNKLFKWFINLKIGSICRHGAGCSHTSLINKCSWNGARRDLLLEILRTQHSAFRPVQLFVRSGGMRILPEDASRGMQRCKVKHASNLCARATMRRRTVSPFIVHFLVCGWLAPRSIKTGWNGVTVYTSSRTNMRWGQRKQLWTK